MGRRPTRLKRGTGIRERKGAGGTRQAAENADAELHRINNTREAAEMRRK